MARIIPSDISRLALSGAHAPEVQTLRALKKQLPDGYTVFHGVHWTREHKSGTRFGEIDFVVLNRSGDVLFIEQKNGALQESDGGLIKAYGDGDKNVADQIARSMEEVLNMEDSSKPQDHDRPQQPVSEAMRRCPLLVAGIA